MDHKKVAAYWRQTAKKDREVMDSLFRSKHYTHALFFGHLVLEKLLKAVVVERTKSQSPYTHDLVRLAEKAFMKIGDSEKKFF